MEHRAENSTSKHLARHSNSSGDNDIVLLTAYEYAALHPTDLARTTSASGDSNANTLDPTSPELCIPHRPHPFANTDAVQLTSTEVALLRDGWVLDIWVAIPRPESENKGVKRTLHWSCSQLLNFCLARKALVKTENVGDDGRWTGPEAKGRLGEVLRGARRS